MNTVLLCLAAYFAGSLPTSYIICRLKTGKDIRTMGSGNAGATNTFRILGWKAGLLVASADFLKAFLPVFFADYIISRSGPHFLEAEILTLIILIVIISGHVFPVWLHFKGGKGMASAAGGITALYPPAVLMCLPLFIFVVRITGYVSLGSLAAAWSLPVFYLGLNRLPGGRYSPLIMGFFILTALMITLFHRANIQRLLRGEETPFKN